MTYKRASGSEIKSAFLLNDLKLSGIYNHKFECINNYEFYNHINIAGTDFPDKVNFNSCNFKSVDILNINFQHTVVFEDCIFDSDFVIDGANFENPVNFINCEFKGDFIINLKECTSLIIKNCICLKECRIVGGRFSSFTYISANEKTLLNVIGRFTFFQQMKLISVIGMTFIAKDCAVNELKIEGYFNTSSRIDFVNIKNYIVEMNNVNNDGKFYFSNFNNCFVNRLTPVSMSEINLDRSDVNENGIAIGLEKCNTVSNNIDLYNHFEFAQEYRKALYDLTAKSSFEFISTIQRPSSFTINLCSLGILELKDIPLQFSNVNIASSDLSSLKMINTRFPLNINAYNSVNRYHVYNDLYTAANRQNNYRDKIDYYVTSQQALLSDIKEEGIWKSLSSYISIYISKYVSRHGSNWGRALRVTFIAGAMMFGLLVISFNDISFDFSVNGFSYFINEILPFLPQFFNPLHKMEFMKDISSDFGGWTGFVDILGRIIIGIGIFEMVRSFRKFVRI